MEIQVSSLEEMCKLMCDNNLPHKEYEYCLRCGRKLKSEESRIIGYGKICLEKAKRKNKTTLF